MSITESEVEAAALEWLESLGWSVAQGPDIAPDTPGAERAHYGAVVLEGRLRAALARLSPDLPSAALDDVFRKLTRPEGATLGSPQPCLPPLDRRWRDGRVSRQQRYDPVHADWCVLGGGDTLGLAGRLCLGLVEQAQLPLEHRLRRGRKPPRHQQAICSCNDSMVASRSASIASRSPSSESS